MKNGLNFIAIDFETATPKRASICEVGICVVRNGSGRNTLMVGATERESL